MKNLLSSPRFYFGVLVICLIVALSALLSRTQNQFVVVHEDKTKLILLENSTDSRQLIIYKDERIEISIGYDQYKKYLLSDEKNPLFSSSIEEYSSEIESAFDRGFLSYGFPAQIDLVIEMLHSGRASVYDKQKDKKLIIILERFNNDVCGPLCGGGNINFYYLDGTLLYKGTEWAY